MLCMCTRSFARANDAKNVRSCDAQCNIMPDYSELYIIIKKIHQ